MIFHPSRMHEKQNFSRCWFTLTLNEQMREQMRWRQAGRSSTDVTVVINIRRNAGNGIQITFFYPEEGPPFYFVSTNFSNQSYALA